MVAVVLCASVRGNPQQRWADYTADFMRPPQLRATLPHCADGRGALRVAMMVRCAVAWMLVALAGACSNTNSGPVAVPADTTAQDTTAQVDAAAGADTAAVADAADVGDSAGQPDAGSTDTQPDVALPTGPTVIINEIAASETPDWFELYNPGAAAVSLSGWKFADSTTDFTKAAPFVAGAAVPPGGYLVVKVSTAANGFGLGSGESLAVLRPDGSECDGTNWSKGQSPKGGSLARVPDATGPFVTSKHPTPGAANQK